MAWRRVWEDRMVEIIVDAHFAGDLVEIARRHPVWVIETAHNKVLIDAAWKVGSEMELCAVNRCPLKQGGVDPVEDFLALLPTVHTHHNWVPPRYVGVIVRGIEATAQIRQELGEAGFVVVESGEDGFVFEVPRREN